MVAFLKFRKHPIAPRHSPATSPSPARAVEFINAGVKSCVIECDLTAGLDSAKRSNGLVVIEGDKIWFARMIHEVRKGWVIKIGRADDILLIGLILVTKNSLMTRQFQYGIQRHKMP